MKKKVFFLKLQKFEKKTWKSVYVQSMVGSCSNRMFDLADVFPRPTESSVRLHRDGGWYQSVHLKKTDSKQMQNFCSEKTQT